MDAATLRPLHEMLRRESHTLLQYLCEAVPWTRATDRKWLPRLQALASRERELLRQVADRIHAEHGSLPPLGAYPSHFTIYNFTSLNFLLPKLIESQRHDIQKLERDLGSVSGSVRPAVEALLRCKREHLEQLSTMTGTRTQGVGQSR